MALENIRGVVFDAFGTLVEIGERRRPYLRLMKLAADAGRRPQPDDADKIMSMDCDIFGVAKWLGVDVSPDLRAAIETDLAAELDSISLFSDAAPVIDYLRSQDIKVAVCSNLAQPYAAPVRALLPEMDAYVWSFEVGAMKPDPAIYRAACKKLNLAPEQILMVGDSLNADVLGPRKFGMNARHLARRGGSPDADTVVSLLDLASENCEQSGWQEYIDEQSGKRTWLPMPLAQAFWRQQLAVRGLLAEPDAGFWPAPLAAALARMPDVGKDEDFLRIRTSEDRAPAKAVSVLPAYACTSCGAKHGAGGTPDATSWQHGICGFCGIETQVSEFRNFRGQEVCILGSDAEYRTALREASAFFENEPEPGTPEGARFEALVAAIEAYEAKYLVDPNNS